MATKKEKTLREYIQIEMENESIAGSLLRKLEKSGIDTPEKLMKLTLNDLLQIKGIGRGSAVLLMAVACDIANKK